MEHKDREIKGKKCEVKPAKSRENKKIFIGGLPADFSEDELRKHFEQFGKVVNSFFYRFLYLFAVFFTFFSVSILARRNRMALRQISK